MQLLLPPISEDRYKSNSQKARIITEKWVEKNMFCPRCGHLKLTRFKNNKPVADFFCEKCGNEYELKSKQGHIETKISGGAYSTMIDRITSNNSPDFFFMNYSISEMVVKDFIIIPKTFFTPNLIEKRKPLSDTARRAGWVGCNILIKNIPEQGFIPIIKDSKMLNKNTILEKMKNIKNIK